MRIFRWGLIRIKRVRCSLGMMNQSQMIRSCWTLYKKLRKMDSLTSRLRLYKKDFIKEFLDSISFLLNSKPNRNSWSKSTISPDTCSISFLESSRISSIPTNWFPWASGFTWRLCKWSWWILTENWAKRMW